MQKTLSRTALALTTALALLAMNPQTVLAQDTATSSVDTKSGLEFKQSNPIPFGMLDQLIGSTYSYKPSPSDTSQMDLGIPVDKEAIVKLLTYTVNDNFVDIAVDVVGFGTGRICIDSISFASNVREALSFMSSPQSAKYTVCQERPSESDMKDADPVKVAVNDRSKAAIAEKINKLKQKEKSLSEELEKIRSSMVELNAKALSLSWKPINNWIIKDFGVWDVNSAGGVEPYFVFTNPNDKSPIKYISLQISLFNAVGDMVGSSIGNQRTKGIRYTGPLAMEDGEDKAQWSPIWYNTTGSCVRVESMSVTWMNGKSQSYAGKALTNAMAPDLSNSCRAKK
jgi:hypothetical protein